MNTPLACTFAHHVDRAAAEAVVRAVLSPASPRGAMERALAARLRLADVDARRFSQALAHPLLPDWDGARGERRSADADHAAFAALRAEGQAALRAFAEEYVDARFPRLLPGDRSRAVVTYTAPRSLAVVARSAGIEAGIIPFFGTPQIERPTLDAFINGKRHRAADANGLIPKEVLDAADPRHRQPETHSSSDVLADVFSALAGAALACAGARRTRALLDGHLFSVALDARLLCAPARPVLQLQHSLAALAREHAKRKAKGGSKTEGDMPGAQASARSNGNAESDSAAALYARTRRVDYRLLAESGRASADALFVVGAYIGSRLLASANGPSLVLARERAALEALRRIHLVERAQVSRPSDALSDDVRTSADLVAFIAAHSSSQEK